MQESLNVLSKLPRIDKENTKSVCHYDYSDLKNALSVWSIMNVMKCAG